MIEVSFTREAIPRPYPFDWGDKSGALAEFHGIVRSSENGVAIAGLRYELYESMSIKEIQRLLEKLGREQPFEKAIVCHRHGFVPVGEAAVYVGILAKHRGGAFGVLSAFMDLLKSEVPIWKLEAVPC